MKAFLTGGTGFIGAPLTRQLVARGWPVTVLSRSGASPHPAAKGVKGDVADKESLRAAMIVAEAEVVIHNAGWYEIGIPKSKHDLMTAINVKGAENVLALAAELKIPKVIHISTTNALGDTGGVIVDETFERRAPILTHYERTKTEAHAIARRYQAEGLPLIIVCPAQVIGPGDHSAFGWFARLYVRGLLPPVVWGPDSRFTYGHVDDVAEGIALAAEKGRAGETYFLGDGVLSNRELVQVW
ncbi:MAG TPA: NAD-dependent epimerase/dehydratase family protein, partial [Anaerolineales bacterium]|nr:NAD-dependent epimerase/dehydratase family protein [Anaerolineales bacterium]